MKNVTLTGLYVFFSIDYETGQLILTMGKCKNEKNRMDAYKVTNANIVFHYFKKYALNELVKAEAELKNTFKKAGYKKWKTSDEQFIVEDETKTREFLSTFMETLHTRKNIKNINYNVSTLEDNTTDIRDIRPPCTFLAGETAMVVTEAGKGEGYRKIPLKFITTTSGKVKELPKTISVAISSKAWSIIQCMRKQEKYNIKTLLEKLNRKTLNNV